MESIFSSSNRSRQTRLFKIVRFFLLLVSAGIQSRAADFSAELIEKENEVISQQQGKPWQRAAVGQKLQPRDRMRTGAKSRAVLGVPDRTMLRLDERTVAEVGASSVILSEGGIYFFSRERAPEIEITTPAANGFVRGTQVAIHVRPGGKTLFTVLEGEVEVSNAKGRMLLRSGEQGDVDIGRAPRKTALIDARNIIQWALYYPGVLDVRDLALTDSDRRAVAASLAAYREGDLLGALEKYPKNHRPLSMSARLYHAAVVLAVGRVDEARRTLASVPKEASGRLALEEMIDAVNFVERDTGKDPDTASGWLARSYYEQSRHRLERALEAARQASMLAPEFGFAGVRVAELEFSFGRTKAALRELDRSHPFSTRNAQAYALRGFLFSANNRIAAAHAQFQSAIDLDGALANAWLGRGLCAIRSGHTAEGRQDLQTAATLEPNRSVLNSYLGKAFSQIGDKESASKDLSRAKELDPNDPTPWLYSAIEKKQENRYNEGITDLEKSIDLNDNRRLYRSRFLLDQDISVRSTNLASLYLNNGMKDVSVREATRAVEGDYTNASAHLFLANSFDALRDSTRISLRYETAWFNELLLANLLSPVGGGPLSQFISQQEYSKLFQADGFGGHSFTEWRDDGRLIEQASLFGNFGNLSFGIDTAYYYDNGRRPNNAVSREEIYWQAKYQVTPNDIFYTFGQWQDNESGDLTQSYSDLPNSTGVQFEEKQEPGQMLVGWNHRWAPGVHTLFLGGRLAAEQLLNDPVTSQSLIFRASTPALDRFFSQSKQNPAMPPVTRNLDNSLSYTKEFLDGIEPFTGRGLVTGIFEKPFRFVTLRQFEIYSGELQHIWETSRNTLIVGGRWQRGDFETDTTLTLLDPNNQFLFSNPAARQHTKVDFERANLYFYDFLKVTPWLTLIGGGSWDKLEHPVNFRNPPVSLRSEETEQYSVKAGFTAALSRALTIRGIYSEGMGGVTFEDSVRLEPVQLAGFNQSFRTIISESLAGSVEAPEYKNWGLSIEGELPTRTWWGASVNVLEQDVQRTIGAFDGFSSDIFTGGGSGYVPGGTTELLSYREEVFSASLNQLMGREFSLGAAYRYTRAKLHDRFPQVRLLSPKADRVDTGVLHELLLFANWNSPTGFFARGEAHWYSQELDGRTANIPTDGLAGDDFWQFDVMAGYRFARNQCEVSAGILNLTDNNYQLSPLTYTSEIPRERTFVVRCRLGF